MLPNPWAQPPARALYALHRFPSAEGLDSRGTVIGLSCPWGAGALPCMHTAVPLLSWDVGAFISPVNLGWEDQHHPGPRAWWRRAVCLLWPQAAQGGLCPGCSPPTVCPAVFYFSCCKNIIFDLSLWLSKKRKPPQAGFAFSPGSSHLCSLLASPPHSSSSFSMHPPSLPFPSVPGHPVWTQNALRIPPTPPPFPLCVSPESHLQSQ